MNAKQLAQIAKLEALAEKQTALDAETIKAVQYAYRTAKVPIETIALTLGISVRTAYHRVAGKGPRRGAIWRSGQ